MTQDPADLAPPDDTKQEPVVGGWRGGWVLPIFLAALAVASVTFGVTALRNLGDQPDAPASLIYVVPPGTSKLVRAGKAPEIMPERVELEVGDSITIRNEDSGLATIGPFVVRPGETTTQTFYRPQLLTGSCSISGSGSVTIVVT